MKFLQSFSNSWGHLIMSLVLIATGLVLILLTNDGTMHGIGTTLILTASGYWFASSVASHNQQPPSGTSTP